MRMRASFLSRPRGPLSRAAARNAALLNLAATPGLGSLLAGRRLAGLGQLTMAICGFLLILGWFLLLALQIYRQLMEDAPTRPIGAIGLLGALLLAGAWLWSLFTSIRFLQEAKRTPQPPPLPRDA